MSQCSSVDCMEMQPQPRCAPRTRARWRRALTTRSEGNTGLSHWLTLLCLALVFLSGTIQAEHVHPAAPGSVDSHAACSLCVTAHVGIETSNPPLPHVTATVIGQAEPRPAEVAFAAPRIFDLYSRPPPSDPTLA